MTGTESGGQEDGNGVVGDVIFGNNNNGERESERDDNRVDGGGEMGRTRLGRVSGKKRRRWKMSSFG